jgi:transposase-like protein
MPNAAEPPECPHCQKPMRLAFFVPKLASYPEIQSFKCADCNEILTKETALLE